LPPRGRSGGILAGFNCSTISVNNVVSGDYCAKFHVKCKNDGFEWALVAVYGAAQEANKPEFLAELVRICESETLPMMVGGDFNIIRRQEEKNNENFNPRWPFIFNALIESLDLREIALSGTQFTWASRRTVPTFEKLDRVLVSVEWEEKFPLVTVRALTRTGSDHTPVLVQTGLPAHVGRNRLFSFELSWLKQEGFF
jgi:endonuclease/exonuclease/phosphatase (EEP) superfamily protein YafD